MVKQYINDDPNSIRYALNVLKENIMINLKVCLPVTVVSYNATDNTVDVQPAIQAVMRDNTYQELPQIFGVPVITLGGNGLSLRIPLKQGDSGIIIVSDRDIALYMQEYKKEGFSSTQPQTLRKHNVADAFFLPSTFGKITPNETSDIVIQNADGTSKLKISSSGIDVKGNLTVDGNISATGDIVASGKMEAGNGASGTFVDSGTGASGKTLTIEKGIITQIS